MLKKHLSEVPKNPVWGKVITLCTTLFFLYLADGIISYWSPNFIEESLRSPLLMGMVIGFSSLVGFLADLVFPELIKFLTVKKLFIFAIISSIISSTWHLSTTFFPILSIFLITMAIWGLYYEFLNFANQQFMADAVGLKLRTSAWAIERIFKQLAYFLGPLLAQWLIASGPKFPAIAAIGLSVVALIIFLLTGKMHDRPMEFDVKEVNMSAEITHWKMLFSYVWPVLILSLFMGLVDATFWTAGSVWTQHLAKESFWGGLFLPFYILPALIVGIAVARFGIYKAKNRLSQILFLASGAAFALLGLNDSVAWQLIIVFIAGSIFAVCLPITDAIYTDIIARMGRERKHMIGLSSSVGNIAYIFGPMIAGFITSKVGERLTFSAMGIMAIIVSIFLLIFTSQKIRLPEAEIQTWDK